ncbi:MAG: ParA family protein [Plesiomonas shigelloides]|jgi:chromosome partitioning protein
MNKNGKIITIKNNKGGVGKTFLTSQLASGLALANKRILILTSDSQNNIFNYLLKGNKDFDNGLKAEISKGNGEYFRLRENLYFLPLEKSTFGNIFIQTLPNYLQKVKNEYDYIIIDSVPTLKVDNVFLENSDYVIIPTHCDEVTMEGVLNLSKEIDPNKILSIVINKFEPTKVQNYFLNLLIENFNGIDIHLPTPIDKSSFIEQMLYNKKTVWEYSNKTALKVQEIIFEIMKELEKRNLEER